MNEELKYQAIAEKMSLWFSQYGRDLPWRRTKDPYCIWISEIMLQQTQVDTVIPYYERFITALPDVKALADADLQSVYKLWEGLGYYRRAAHLKMSAQMIMEEGGQFPSSYEALIRLKGIGDYTASAIASIAFGEKKGVVDGNTLRITSRVWQLKDNIALPATKKRFGTYMDRLAGEGDPGLINQAMMDLGAMICLPRHPKCELCPIAFACKAREAGRQALLPVNVKKMNKVTEQYVTVVIRRGADYLLYKPEQGLLAGLYGMVQIQAEDPEDFEQRFF